jgi:DDE superfamily endonuclease
MLEFHAVNPQLTIDSPIVKRNITKDAQINGDNFDTQVAFVNSVNGDIIDRKIPVDCIVNMDETNIPFCIKPKWTYRPKGTKTVAVKLVNSSQRATALLAVTMSGEKLPPFLIFAGKADGPVSREPETEQYPGGVEYGVQKKAWCDGPLMQEWIDKVWEPFCASKPVTMLLFDHFRGHLVADVLARLEALGTIVHVIPASYTGTLQPIDVGINKPFKDGLRKLFMLRNSQVLDGLKERPRRRDIAKWVKLVWQTINWLTICRTWRHIGFVDENMGDWFIDVVAVDLDAVVVDPYESEMDDDASYIRAHDDGNADDDDELVGDWEDEL